MWKKLKIFVSCSKMSMPSFWNWKIGAFDYRCATLIKKREKSWRMSSHSEEEIGVVVVETAEEVDNKWEVAIQTVIVECDRD